MINFLIVVFIITLIYLAKVEMVKSYFTLLAFQGVLLFGLAFYELFELHQGNIIQFAFILLETLIFKAIFVPWFMMRVTRNKVHRHHGGPVKGYYSVFIAAIIIVASFITAHLIHNQHLQVKYFTAAISSIIVGLFVAINNRDLVTHLVSYLVIENGIFLLSLALGSEMPMFVNSAILLDIFTSVLIMGVFFNKMKEYFSNTDAGQLTQLKD
jgi:hydrogenase-4 component E